MVNRKKSGGRLGENIEPSLPLFSIDDCPESVPAAGYRNGSSLNNAGSNGNYWSSTPNESNTNNAYELNFNSSNHNVNWNNRNNGRSVRPVSELTPSAPSGGARRFSITPEQLLRDLYRAYRDARKHKRGRSYQLRFEFYLEDNLVNLRDELLEGRYSPRPSTCFIIHDPKMREVFAADFRDRIVHHLFYNYTHVLFERTFIADSYSCIEGRGTHYGIDRLRHHIRSVSAGYSRPCYVLKVDVRGYFMHIDRTRLMRICRQTLAKMKHRSSDTEGRSWGEVLDYPFVDYLLECIVHADPLRQCRLLGSPDDWHGLPREKSLFFAAEGCGLPIGNLSSQLFSNIYMNLFDQYAKRSLGCRHYGRYVDDAYIVSGSRDFLKSLLAPMARFLESELGLTLHPHKSRIFDVRQGVEFLGAYHKPFRTYVSHSSLRRMKCKAFSLPADDGRLLQSAVNSYLGVLSHYDSYCLRRVLFGFSSGLVACGRFGRDWLTFRPCGKL